MTVQNMTVKNVYEGNGSATVFPYTFALSPEDGEHINVYVTDENNISRRVTNFTVDTTAKTVKYPIGGDPLPAGKRLTLRREIPAQQELNLENQGAFFAEDVESQFDRNVMMIQQLAETLQRAIVVDVASDKKPEDLLTEILSNLKDAVAAMNRAVAAANASEASAERSTQESGNSEASAKRSAGSAATSEQMAASATSSEKAAAASADTAKTWAGAAEESAKKALASESAASTSADTAKTWAGKAETQADSVVTLLTNLQQVNLYNPSTTYTPGQCAMLPNGDVYRCIKACQGVAPGTDGGTHWKSLSQPSTTLTTQLEFSYKEGAPPQYFTVPCTGLYHFTLKGGGGGGTCSRIENGYSFGGNGGGEGGTTYAHLYLTKGEQCSLFIGGAGRGSSFWDDKVKSAWDGGTTSMARDATGERFYAPGGKASTTTRAGLGGTSVYDNTKAKDVFPDIIGQAGQVGQCVPNGNIAAGGWGGHQNAKGGGGWGGCVDAEGRMENGGYGAPGFIRIEY